MVIDTCPCSSTRSAGRLGKRQDSRPWRQRVGRPLAGRIIKYEPRQREGAKTSGGWQAFRFCFLLARQTTAKARVARPTSRQKTQQQKHRVDAEQIHTKRGSTGRDGPRPARCNGRATPQRAPRPEFDRPPATAGRPSKRAPGGDGQGATAMPAAPPSPLKRGGNLGGTVAVDGAPPTCPPRTPMEHHRAPRATVA